MKKSSVNNIKEMLKNRRDFYFNRLQKIERILATIKILQKDISELFLENYKISKSENLVNFKKYLDIFQKEINTLDKKYLMSKLDDINKK